MRLGPPTLAALLFAITASLAPFPAGAQNVAVADALFKKGLDDMQAGRYETGCPALGESYRVDPQPGTLFTLAECHAKAGHVATARARYEDYLQFFATLTAEQKQRQRGREKIAAAKKEELAPDVPTLTLTLAQGTPKGTRVTCDTLELTAASLGIALPLDPGEHVVRGESPGGGVTEERFTLTKGEKKSMDLLVPAEPPKAPPPKMTPPLAAPPPPGLGGRRLAAIALGGVGIAGLGAGVAFGVITQRRLGVIEDHCTIAPGQADVCDKAGFAAHESALISGWVSTGGFILGGAGLATAAVLFFLKPAAPRSSPSTALLNATLTPMEGGGVGVVLSGAF